MAMKLYCWRSEFLMDFSRGLIIVMANDVEEAVECFHDCDRPLGKLLELVKKGYEILEEGLGREVDNSWKGDVT